MKNPCFQFLTPHESVLWLIAQRDKTIADLQNKWSTHSSSNIVSLAKAAKVYRLPTLISLPADNSLQWVKAPLQRMFPEATVVSQLGAIDLWNDLDLVRTMQATGRKQVILAGVSAGGCLYFPAITALQMGYEVWVVYKAADDRDAKFDVTTLARLQQAGCVICEWTEILTLLQRGELTTPTTKTLKLFDEHWLGGVAEFNFKQSEAS